MTLTHTYSPTSPSLHSGMAERLWYVRVTDTVYGPFDDRTIWTYVQEGRVTALSDLSLRPEDGYQAAKNWLEIAHWFHAPAVLAPAEPEIVSNPIFTTRMLVMAEIRSGRDSVFQQMLDSIGVATRVGETIWILQSDADQEQLKLILGPTLSVSDRLFIVDASHADYTAYNLGPNLESELAEAFQP